MRDEEVGLAVLVGARHLVHLEGRLSAFSGGSPGRTVRVKLRRFDDAVDWETFPGRLLIKIDVEGSETAFLRGATQAISSRRPKILVEVNPGAMDAAGTEAGEGLRPRSSISDT